MGHSRASTVLKHVRKLVAAHELDRLADRCLVQRFAQEGDAAAFEALVHRHGPMVFRVCRQVLRHVHDAEDVFQATFLVLARKASAIKKQASVASWLHGVAYRLSMQARNASTRQRAREQLREPAARVELPADVTWQELQERLHEELARLNDAYRAPLVLCYLESKTQDEAARQLGWSVGTLRRRLDAGRKLLHARLTRRGLTLPAALLAAGLSQQTSDAAITATLIAATAKAACAFAAGKSLGCGEVLAGSATLAEAALKRMFLAKPKTVSLLLLVFGIVAGGAGLLSQHALTANHAGETQAAGPEAPTPVTGKVPSDQQQVPTDVYGDPLPPRALARLGTIRFRHGSQVNGLALSPQGKTLATGSEDDRSIFLWDVETGRILRRFRAPDGAVPHEGARSLAFTRDGTMLASTCLRDWKVRLWEVSTGKQLRRFKTDDNWWFGHVAFSPDGKILAGASPAYQIVVWDTATGRVLHRLDAHQRCSFPAPIAFSPDGQTLASGGPAGAVYLWDVRSGKEKQRLSLRPPPKDGDGPPFNRGMIHAVAFSPDGRNLASTAQLSPTRLWDVASGKEIRVLQGDRWGAFSVAFSPDGKLVSSGEGTGMVRTWETSTGKELAHFHAHARWVSGLAFAPDGRTLISSGDTSIRSWEARTGKEITPERGHTGGIGDCCLLPDKKTLMTTSLDNGLRQWDIATGKELRRFAVPHAETGYLASALALAPDGKTVVLPKDKSVDENSSERGACLWDLRSGKELAVLGRANIFSAWFSADGKAVLTHSWDVKEHKGFIRSWDVATGKEIRVLAKLADGIRSFVLAPDGGTLAALCQDREPNIRFYRTAGGQELGRISGSAEFNQCVAFSPDGTMLAVADGPRPRRDSRVLFHYIHLWHVATGKELRQFGKSSTSYWPIQFSPDGRTLATAGEDARIRLWEVATGEQRAEWTGHAGQVWKLLFADHGRTLISASADTTALVWDVTGLRSPGGDASSDLPQLWHSLGDANAPKAYAALWAMTALPGPTERFLAKHLRPAVQPDEKVIAQHMRDLDSPVFAVRQKASLALSKLDRLAEPALRKALTGQPSFELRRRIEQLLERLEAVPSGAWLQTLRALELLEHLGTPNAKRLLRSLAAGAPGAGVTEEAKAVLPRLQQR
jgi:RNA polymerase sigma factor (sigma-70 family)